MKKIFSFLLAIVILLALTSFFSPKSLAVVAGDSCPNQNTKTCASNTNAILTCQFYSGGQYIVNRWVTTTNCPSNKVCAAYQGGGFYCQTCATNYAAINNVCTFRCTDNSPCTDYQTCVNGGCMNISCPPPQIIKDRQCVNPPSTCSVNWGTFPPMTTGNSYAFPLVFSSSFGYTHKAVYMTPTGAQLAADYSADTSPNITVHLGSDSVTVGSHTFKAYINNSSGQGVECTPEKTITVTDQASGNQDGAACVPPLNTAGLSQNIPATWGWACIPGSSTQISVFLYLDYPQGNANAKFLARVTANSNRSDADFVKNSGCESIYHGWVYNIDSTYQNSNHIIYAYSLNPDSGTYALLSTSPMTYTACPTNAGGERTYTCENTAGQKCYVVASGQEANAFCEDKAIGSTQGDGTCPQGFTCCKCKTAGQTIVNGVCTTPSGGGGGGNTPSGDGHTRVNFKIGLDGIGVTGDQPNPSHYLPVTGQPGTGSNFALKRPSRDFTITINSVKHTQAFTFDNTKTSATYGLFTGTIDLGTSFATADYTIFASAEAHLVKKFPTAIHIVNKATTSTPRLNLVAGDVTGAGTGTIAISTKGVESVGTVDISNANIEPDNKLTIYDYTVLMSCLSDKDINDFDSKATCKKDGKAGVDFTRRSNLEDNAVSGNDVVDKFDYNLFVREFSKVQNGD